MICPSCGVDTDAYLREQKEEAGRAEKERELERMFDKQLRQVRRKRAIVWAVIGAIGGGLLVTVLILLLLWPAVIVRAPSYSVYDILVTYWRYVPVGGRFIMLGFSLLYCGFIGYTYGKYSSGKQERELRRSFGL